ncbi:hypothetical protein [Natrinema thermotolerans]
MENKGSEETLVVGDDVVYYLHPDCVNFIIEFAHDHVKYVIEASKSIIG